LFADLGKKFFELFVVHHFAKFCTTSTIISVIQSVKTEVFFTLWITLSNIETASIIVISILDDRCKSFHTHFPIRRAVSIFVLLNLDDRWGCSKLAVAVQIDTSERNIMEGRERERESRERREGLPLWGVPDFSSS
jgi:hypothetical protein